PGEEGQQCSGFAGLVAVVQVVCARIVEVHGGLHQPQPESAQIEVDVALWITTDRGDVVQATGLKRHGSSSCGGVTSNATEINSFEEDIFLKDCAYTEIRVHGTRRRARRRSGRPLVGPCDRG